VRWRGTAHFERICPREIAILVASASGRFPPRKAFEMTTPNTITSPVGDPSEEAAADRVAAARRNTDPAAARAHAAELTRIAASAKRFGVEVDVDAAIMRGVDPAALRERVMETAAGQADATAIDTTAPPLAGSTSPASSIVSAARRQAARGTRP
jgi:hypothetical protein